MSSQSATNRVKDLKAKLLNKQQKPESNASTTVENASQPSVSSGGMANHAVPPKARSRQPPDNSQSVHSSINREHLVNFGVSAKLELNEDRALASLVKSVMHYVFDDTTGLDAVGRSLDTYIAKELALVNLEGCVLQSAVDSIKSARETIDESNRDLISRFPEFHNLVSDASINKRRRLEYNEKALEILGVDSKEQSRSRVRRIEEILNELRHSNRKLARTIEYRKRQMEPLTYWAKVLESGHF